MSPCDVFLSHNSADKAMVEDLAERLQGAGVKPFFKAWHLVAGKRWQIKLEEALGKSDTCAVFFGPEGIGRRKDEYRPKLSTRHCIVKGHSKKIQSNTSMRKTMPKTKDALRIIDRLTGDDLELREMIAEERVNAQVARMIYEARTTSGLTQKQLAELIGTQQSTIARLEDADYEGHSLRMLRRIADALNQRLEVRFVPKRAA